jgi:hypothetical protein
MIASCLSWCLSGATCRPVPVTAPPTAEGRLVTTHSIEENGQITRAQAPVGGVSAPAHLGIGSALVDSLDYVVMLQVLFDIASGVESTPLTYVVSGVAR